MIIKATVPLFALAVLAACGSKEHEGADAAASASAPTMGHKPPSASASAPAPATSATAAPKEAGGPKWLGGVPAKHAAVKVGEKVWAVTPEGSGENVAFGLVEVESEQGDFLTTVGFTHAGKKLEKDASTKRMHVPGALVSPAAEAGKLKKGDLVIAPIFGYHTTAAHVDKVSAAGADIKYVQGDKVHDETTEYAAPLAKGIAPFAYVAVKNGASWKEMLVAAVVDDQVFGVDEAGNFHKAAKADVKPLDVAWKDRKKGESVVVFDADGSAETKIDAVSVEKWVYKVKINGAEKRVPFYAVVDKL